MEDQMSWFDVGMLVGMFAFYLLGLEHGWGYCLRDQDRRRMKEPK